MLLFMFFTFKISFIKKKTVLITSITILRTYYFYNDMINLENFDSNLLKIDKKRLIFTTLDTLQLKKLMIVKIFTV